MECNIVCDNIRKRRLELGITQEYLAEKSNIDVANISKIERHQRLPNISSLSRLAAALNTTVGALIGEEAEDCFKKEVDQAVKRLSDIIQEIPASKKELFMTSLCDMALMMKKMIMEV